MKQKPEVVDFAARQAVRQANKVPIIGEKPAEQFVCGVQLLLSKEGEVSIVAMPPEEGAPVHRTATNNDVLSMCNLVESHINRQVIIQNVLRGSAGITEALLQRLGHVPIADETTSEEGTDGNAGEEKAH